jgi:acylphosphatase
MIRRTVHFRGRVQGVGFRYTAEALARRLPLTGFVQNLSDGRVKLVVEGDAVEIDRLIDAIQQAMVGLVRDAEQAESTATGEFGGFTIRH